VSITLEQARAIVAGVRARGRDKGFKPLTAVVLDAGDHVVAVEREDGSSTKRCEVAHGKAHDAISLGLGSRALMALESSSRTSSPRSPTRWAPSSRFSAGVLVTDADGSVLGVVWVYPGTRRTTTRPQRSQGSAPQASPAARTDAIHCRSGRPTACSK
jgi:uncharacterized protein GlcG (DUF336 family)